MIYRIPKFRHKDTRGLSPEDLQCTGWVFSSSLCSSPIKRDISLTPSTTSEWVCHRLTFSGTQLPEVHLLVSLWCSKLIFHYWWIFMFFCWVWCLCSYVQDFQPWQSGCLNWFSGSHGFSLKGVQASCGCMVFKGKFKENSLNLLKFYGETCICLLDAYISMSGKTPAGNCPQINSQWSRFCLSGCEKTWLRQD